MINQSVVNLHQEDSQAKIQFIKSVCERIGEAMGSIEDICTEQLEPNPEPSSYAQYEGIGLYIFIKENEEASKTEYPAFNHNEILSILLSKWQSMTKEEKASYCSKIDLKKVQSSKKLRKLNKLAEKVATISQLETKLCEENNDQDFQQITGSKRKPNQTEEEKVNQSADLLDHSKEIAHQQSQAPSHTQATPAAIPIQTVCKPDCHQMQIQSHSEEKASYQVLVEKKPELEENQENKSQTAQQIKEPTNQAVESGCPSSELSAPKENLQNESPGQVVSQQQPEKEILESNVGLTQENTLLNLKKTEFLQEKSQQLQVSKSEKVESPQASLQNTEQSKLAQNVDNLTEEKNSNQEEASADQVVENNVEPVILVDGENVENK